jgi:hypothetical protein
MKILTARGSMEEEVLPMIKETNLGKNSHSDDENLMSATKSAR